MHGALLDHRAFPGGRDRLRQALEPSHINAEFFNAGLSAPDAVLGRSLAARTFVTRVQLLRAAAETGYDSGFPTDLVSHLGSTMRGLPRHNFLVRPHLAAVERFAQNSTWEKLTDADAAVADHELAPLAAVVPGEGEEESRRFDLLVLQTELAALNGDTAALARLGAQLVKIASALQDQGNIPRIAAQLHVIDAVVEMSSDDGAWPAVDPLWLETVRRKLRDLVPLMEKRRRNLVNTDFEDVRGELTEIDLEGVKRTAFDVSYCRERVALHLRGHLDHIAMQRLGHGRALTTLDLATLEEMLLESGAGSRDDLDRASAGDLSGFIRSLVGLDPQAVQEAFAEFISESTLHTRQLKLLNMLISQLTRGGRMDAGALYEPPYTEIAPHGSEDLFAEDTVNHIFSVVDRFGGADFPASDDFMGETA